MQKSLACKLRQLQLCLNYLNSSQFKLSRAGCSIIDYMICPFCNQKDSRVLESRLTTENSVRRRRQCEHCEKRFTTYERLEVIQLLVVKRSGNREPYTREKYHAGVARAVAKTQITGEQVDDLVDSVENELATLNKREIPSTLLGEMTLARLRNLDQIAYVRFCVCVQAVSLD